MTDSRHSPVFASSVRSAGASATTSNGPGAVSTNGSAAAPTAAPTASPAERALFRRFLRGEVTFAQLEGLTAGEARTLAGLGHDLFRQGRLDDARTLFEGLSALNPLDPYAHQILGAIEERRGRPEAARRRYDLCLSLDGANAWVRARRGELLLKAGEVQAGVADLVEAARLAPGHDVPAVRRAKVLLALLQRAAREAAPEATGSLPPASA